MQENGVPVRKGLIAHCDNGGMVYAEVETAMKNLLKQKPDVIFAGSDKITTGCMKFLKAKKINIPKELALIGFSNNDLTELLNPSLSVIRQPAFEMGQAAMTLLLSLIESKRPQTKFETRIQSIESQIG